MRIEIFFDGGSKFFHFSLFTFHFFVYLCKRNKEFVMKKIKNILLRIYHVKALKYAVVTVIAIALVGFIDENSVWKHMKNQSRISDLQEEIARYTEQYKRDDAQVELLRRDPKAIQKIARERYFMKADNEDIFVLSDDEQTFSFAESDETVE